MAARVAFQGERGAYSEMAALRYFPGATLVPHKSFADVFEAAQKGRVDYAVVPVENSIEGSVGEVYDLLLGTRLRAVGEAYLRVRHCLIANRGVRMGDVKVVYSHPQALGQCRGYLQKKRLEAMPAYDTAGSAKLVKERGLKDAAAIASRLAAKIYGMQVLDEGIEDRKSNYTRFLVMSGTKPAADDGACKTSIIFSVRHVPGALFGILGEFAIRRLNLTKIESRPTKETPWEYNFYVDFEGNAGDRVVRQALAAIRPKTSYLKVLGSYKKAKFR
jgi:prephenate dehydratase